MPDTPHPLGLALSGGGYRATAFHLGTLKKLHEMNLLDKVDVVSTISGGSITGAAWCLSDKPYMEFHADMVAKLQTKNVLKWVFTSFTFFKTLLFLLVFLGGTIYLLFTCWAPFSPLVFLLMCFLLYKFQYKIFPVSKEIERAYDSFFFNKQTLKDLRDKHIIAIGSSNLQTGRPFTFSKNHMGDSAYGSSSSYKPPIFFKPELFPVSRAVMASSCVPFAFSPVLVATDYFKDAADAKRVHPQLIDGGVYDNQGIQKITQQDSFYCCQNVIVSDAGGNFSANLKYPNAISLLMRTVDLFMYRIKASSMVQHIYNNVHGAGRPIAYFSLGWELIWCIPGFIKNMIEGQVLPSVIQAHGFKEEWIKDPVHHQGEIKTHLETVTGYAEILKRNLTDAQWEFARKTGTNLTPLSKDNIDWLIIQAENMTELQVKLYCPHLLPK